MKHKVYKIFLILLVVVLLTTCMGSKKYVLYQGLEQIECIEIVSVNYYDPSTPLADMTVKRIIPTDEIPQFVRDLLAIKCYKYWNDPKNYIEGISIKIRYKDGMIEMITPASCGLFIEQGDYYQIKDFNRFYLDDTSFYELLDKYLEG